ncbi:monooxygenase 1-like isoform X2 [Tasmannia lanceolata]|uniref:monooxygenase 1-like isoform X2 n=1 Tax=Tasmannia lanceolata TaxID=3420 RepID=UPI004063D4E2
MNISNIDYEIAIVGGGICGLATALALHRKGLRSVVLERAESLRATGAAIGVWTNGWRALDQLGVGPMLRQKAMLIRGFREISVDGKTIRVIPNGKEEHRCLRRSDLIEALAVQLPPQTIHFGCRIVSVEIDQVTSFPVLHLHDGSVIRAKVVLGCDGVSSIVAESIGLKPPRISRIIGMRGLTTYPKGHGFSNEFIRMKEKCLLLGIVPIDDKLVYWFISRPRLPKDSGVSREPKVLIEAMVEEMKDFPAEITEMVKNSDLDSLSYTQIRYRAPWDLLWARFRIATMTVAGDAMHVMGPFLGQGGSAGLEDAIVLARCLAKEICLSNDRNLRNRVEIRLDMYIKERKMRILMLSATTYLVGLMRGDSSTAKMVLILAIVRIFFGNRLSHAQYDCGRL